MNCNVLDECNEKTMYFDKVFNKDDKINDMFIHLLPNIHSVLNGCNASIIAHGISGKLFSFFLLFLLCIYKDM